MEPTFMAGRPRIRIRIALNSTHPSQTSRRALKSSPQPGIAGAVDQLFIALARSASNPADSFRPAACSGSVHR